MSSNTIGYGPRNSLRPRFDGDERHFELWLVKFTGFLRIRGLHKVFNQEGDDEVDEEKNADIYAELVQLLDDK